MPENPTPPGARAGRREWFGLVVLFLPTLLISMDVSIMLYALPHITAALKPSSAQQLWMSDMYGFVLSGLLVTMGVLGDRIGRRRLLMIGAVVFGGASVITAYSDQAGTLIAARALLGVGGATLMPSTLALIRNMFTDPRQRSTAVAVWTGATTGGIAIGPVIGGFLLTHFWWGSAFLVNVPVMVLLLVVAPLLLPEYRGAHPGRFDILSSLLSLAAVLPVIYGIQDIAQDGIDARRIVAIVVGVLFGAVFTWRQTRLEHPMIDLRLFRKAEFSGAVLVATLAMFALLGVQFYTPQYMQLVLGLTPFAAALWSLPAVACVGGFAGTSAGLAESKRPAYIVCVGLVFAAVGCVLLGTISSHENLAVFLVYAGIISCGIVMGLTLTSDMIVSAVPADRAGAASAVSETAQEFGAALGFAVLGSIGTAVYRSRMDGAPPIAKSTLGEAVAYGDQTHDAALLQQAHAAFTHALSTVSVTAAGILVVGAVLATFLLRKVPPIGKQTADPAEPAAKAPAPVTNPAPATNG